MDPLDTIGNLLLVIGREANDLLHQVWEYLRWLFIWLQMKISTGYGLYIRPTLVMFGLCRPSTWADVEAYRLKQSRRLGEKIPRVAALEKGLEQEIQKTNKQRTADPFSHQRSSSEK